MEYKIVSKADFQFYIKALADLRIVIFREYPYLYDGDMQSEVEYLKSYVNSKDSLLILVIDENKIVGAVTGIPLKEIKEMSQISLDDVYYLGEILLLKEYRGKGLGYQLYQRFEEVVRQKKKYKKIGIAEVIRDENDERKPKNYKPARKFWEGIGFIVEPDKVMHVSYKEIGNITKTIATLVFSFKSLSAPVLPNK